ncbi:FkbM family methyltransferase, partial [Rhodoplanes serenus]
MLRSYAQNFEDVILFRALKDVTVGSYIDIGAQDPVFDSVSLAFYERGWRGTHVEPSRNYSELLRRARVDERVIEAAVS